ncbi:hypothetical protein V8E51_012444, partial [Hyaloscypha variabilis]
PITIETERHNNILQPQQLETPTTSESLMSLRRQIDESIAQGRALDSSCKLHIQKLANAAENAFADRAILLDENLLLFDYEDIVEAQRQRDIKEAAAEAVRGRRRSNRKSTSQVLGKRSRGEELELAEREIRTLGMAEYCSVLDF